MKCTLAQFKSMFPRGYICNQTYYRQYERENFKLFNVCHSFRGSCIWNGCVYVIIITYSHFAFIIIMRNIRKWWELYNAWQVYSAEFVFKIKSILRDTVCVIYGTEWFLLNHYSCNDLENICTSSYYHHHSGNKKQKSLLRFRPWDNGMSCMYCYVLIICIQF